MKKNRLRIISFLLVISIVAAAFAACGETEPVKDPTPTHVD